MTVNEAIKILDRMANDFTTWQEETEALDLAIRSVKAWDKVRAEIKRYRGDCELACSSMKDNGICEGCNKACFDSIERIIEKHVKEVYNEST